MTIIVILAVYFIIVVIHSIMRENGFKPKEISVIETKETQFEKFRKLGVSLGFPFDGIEGVNDINGRVSSYFQSKRNAGKSYYEILFIDKHTGCIVLETKDSISCLPEILK